MNADSFVKELSNLVFENTFNPYSERCEIYDVYDAPQRRSTHLKKMLTAACEVDVDSIWIGRDLGYRGGRRTGLALTDDIHFCRHLARWGIEVSPLTKGQAVPERTAAAIWSVLGQITSPIFLWNVFPLHPHEAGNPFSNRAHNSRERLAGEELLDELVNLLRPKRIISIGNDAEKATVRLKGQYELFKVRHPSYGGKNIFIEQIGAIYGLNGGSDEME